ncbi:MAG: phospholipase D-like domain-containing protein [Ktedonobacteraceae bacterium]
MVDSKTTFSQAGLDIYFQSKRAGLDAQLASRLEAFIDATQQTLDCAIYDLRYPGVLDALARVAHAGKQLRIVFDGGKERAGGLMADPKPAGTEQALRDAGLLQYATAVHEGGRHLMHDKFLVRDGQYTWTGSANFTDGGLNLQDNQCLVVASPEVAATYTAIFEASQRGDHHSHPPAQSSTPISSDGITLTPMFEPEAGENIEQVIVDALSGAQRVRMLAFLVSDSGILDALANFASDTADISGVYDPHGMQNVLRYSKQDPSRFWFMHDPRFVAAPSHAFNPKREQDFMHNKVFIIDDHLVLTGSYNFSENAEANDENLVAIDSQAVAAAYTAYFDALYKKYAHSGPHNN